MFKDILNQLLFIFIKGQYENKLILHIEYKFLVLIIL